jgi:hypothetical protein
MLPSEKLFLCFVLEIVVNMPVLCGTFLLENLEFFVLNAWQFLLVRKKLLNIKWNPPKDKTDKK